MGFQLIMQPGDVTASLTWITVNLQAKLRDLARVPGRRPSEGCDSCAEAADRGRVSRAANSIHLQ